MERNILLPPALSPPLSQQEQLRRFFLIWTLKEAYTKALGLGLGFDFSRIEYDVPNDMVRIDGIVPRDWEFTRFELQNEIDGGRTEKYVGVVARFIGESGRETRVHVVHPGLDWLKVWSAADFLGTAIAKLVD